MKRLVTVIVVILIVSISSLNMTQPANSTSLIGLSAADVTPGSVKIEHIRKQSVGGALHYFADECLGTLVAPDLILTHNHFTQPLGRLPGETFLFEDAVGRSSYWRVSDLKLTVINSGTLLIRLPTRVFSDTAPVADPATERQLKPGAWLAVSYWDDQTQRLAQHNFQVIQTKDGIAKLADPDMLINPGDSGGGVFIGERLVGNTWSIDMNQAGEALGALNVALVPSEVVSVVGQP